MNIDLNEETDQLSIDLNEIKSRREIKVKTSRKIIFRIGSVLPAE